MATEVHSTYNGHHFSHKLPAC